MIDGIGQVHVQVHVQCVNVEIRWSFSGTAHACVEEKVFLTNIELDK